MAGEGYEHIDVGSDLCPTCRARRLPVAEGIIADAMAVIHPAVAEVIQGSAYERVMTVVDEQVYRTAFHAAGINRWMVDKHGSTD